MKTQFKLDRQWSCVESAEEEENEVVIHDSIQNEETISNVNVEELYKYIQTKKTVEKDVEIDVVSSTPLRRSNNFFFIILARTPEIGQSLGHILSCGAR